MIIFGLLALSVVVLFGNNMRCLAVDGDCPGFCRHKVQSCNLDPFSANCAFNNSCRAPSWPEYRDDFEDLFKTTFKL